MLVARPHLQSGFRDDRSQLLDRKINSQADIGLCVQRVGIYLRCCRQCNEGGQKITFPRIKNMLPGMNFFGALQNQAKRRAQNDGNWRRLTAVAVQGQVGNSGLQTAVDMDSACRQGLHLLQQIHP
ncbi:hypothetical protein D3C73_1136010 [compost metagenome]